MNGKPASQLAILSMNLQIRSRSYKHGVPGPTRSASLGISLDLSSPSTAVSTLLRTRLACASSGRHCCLALCIYTYISVCRDCVSTLPLPVSAQLLLFTIYVSNTGHCLMRKDLNQRVSPNPTLFQPTTSAVLSSALILITQRT